MKEDNNKINEKLGKYKDSGLLGKAFIEIVYKKLFEEVISVRQRLINQQIVNDLDLDPDGTGDIIIYEMENEQKEHLFNQVFEVKQVLRPLLDKLGSQILELSSKTWL